MFIVCFLAPMASTLLLGAQAYEAQQVGKQTLQTYTFASENQAKLSLQGAGFHYSGRAYADTRDERWNHPSLGGRTFGQDALLARLA